MIFRGEASSEQSPQVYRENTTEANREQVEEILIDILFPPRVFTHQSKEQNDDNSDDEKKYRRSILEKPLP